MSRIAVLLTCYNRKQTTLGCLKALRDQHVECDIYLVDDRSPDETGRVVKEEYPDVHVLLGTGNLFWNRGMHLAWKAASDLDYDFYLWLNDDTKLKSSALEDMLCVSMKHSNEVIICGATQDECSLNFTYGGRDRAYIPIIPNGSDQSIYYMNGNIVLVPRAVYQKVGMLDPYFHHDIGDFDYGLRARKLGVKILSSYDFVGFCERNLSALTKERLMGVSLIKRLIRLFSPFGQNPFQQFKFAYRHQNVLKAIYVFFKLIFINIVPDQLYKSFITPPTVAKKREF